jgi:hypothetical protein
VRLKTAVELTTQVAEQKVRIALIDETSRKVPWFARDSVPSRGGFRLALSRLGEERLDETLSFQTDLAINAGRKTTQRTEWRIGSTQIVNFDYQSRNLGVIEAYAPGGVVITINGHLRMSYDLRAHFEPLGKDIPDDPEIAALLASHLEALKKKGKQRVEIEYWMMPECPGCKQARPELKALRTELAGRVNIVPHWVVERHDGELSSLHGPRELDEARIQALVGKYYPERIWEWFDWRERHPKESWEDGAAALKLLPVRLAQGLASKECDALLNADYELAERRQVRSTPELIVGNRPYEGEIERLHLLGALCGSLDAPQPEACANAPKCFFDAQCRKRGFVAKCIEAGKPTAHCDNSQPAVPVPAVVLYDPDALHSGHETILNALVNDLPGIDIRMLNANDGEGAALVKRAHVTRLPAFLISPDAKKEFGYLDSVGRAAREIAAGPDGDAWNHWLLLREDQGGVGSRQFVDRPRIKGRADLFVSRFSKNGEEALETALEFKTNLNAVGMDLAVHDAIFWTRDDPPKLAAHNGIAEIEEAERAEVVRKLAPGKFEMYLLERGLKRGSSYWDKAVKTIGLEPADVRADSEAPAPWVLKILQDNATLLKNVDAGGEIVLLAENCEVIPIASRVDLRQTLERIAQRNKRR